MFKITKTNTGATFRVRIQPRASKNEIVEMQEDALKVRISAPPVKGKANRALIGFLAKELGVKKSEIEIASGQTSKIKTIHIVGEGTEKLRELIDGPLS